MENEDEEEVIKENLDVLFPLASEKEMPETKFLLSPSLLKWNQDQVTDLGKQMRFSEQEKKQMTRVDSNETTRLHTYPIKKRSGLESPWRLRSWPAGRYLLIRMPTVNPLQTNPVSPDGFLSLTSHRLYLLISVNL